MSMTRLYAFDGVGTKKENALIRNSNLKTEILFRSLDTGEIIGKKTNKVILPGAGYIARQLFDIAEPEVCPSYNSALGLDLPEGEQTPVDWSTATDEYPKVLLFCLGTNGCGNEGSQVYAVDYNSWITPDSIIPMRYPLNTNDLSDDLRESYFGRKEDGDYVAYYFKRFTSGPVLHQQYIDGTPIASNVLETGDDVETYVETIFTVLKEDCREFFVATTGIDECKFNSISLCYGTPVQIGDYVYFKNIRPMTRLNIPNEMLIDVTKGVEIIYHTYI